MQILKTNGLLTLKRNKILLFLLILGGFCSKKEPNDHYTQIYLDRRPSIFYSNNKCLPRLVIDTFVVKKECALIVVTDVSLHPMSKLYIIRKRSQILFVDDLTKGQQASFKTFWTSICNELTEGVSVETKKELCQFALAHYYGLLENITVVLKKTNDFYLFAMGYSDTIVFDDEFKIRSFSKSNMMIQ
jgi:hypothetical protein